jgi:hypothetical protein
MDAPFYVGYQKKMSPELAAFLRPLVIGLLGAVALAAAVLVAEQRPFDASVFEFGKTRDFQGIVSAQPYPSLALVRPGRAGDAGTWSRYLLVARGKHGAQDLVRDSDGKSVALRGSLIHRDNQAMIEIEPGSVRVLENGDVAPTETTVLGRYTLVGEIVDSKCFYGVMKPGHLKTHRACAVRCISGGITPVFLVRDAEGSALHFVLVGADGRPVNQEVLGMVAEPLEITGAVERQDDMLLLKAEPATFRRL